MTLKDRIMSVISSNPHEVFSGELMTHRIGYHHPPSVKTDLGALARMGKLKRLGHNTYASNLFIGPSVSPPTSKFNPVKVPADKFRNLTKTPVQRLAEKAKAEKPKVVPSVKVETGYNIVTVEILLDHMTPPARVITELQDFFNNDEDIRIVEVKKACEEDFVKVARFKKR
jgi:hypothetical protein